MNIKWRNDYSQSGKLILTHVDGRVIELLVDEGDKPLLKKYQWLWSVSDTDGTKGYAYTTDTISKRQRPLHQYLNPAWKLTDHINRDTKDNRRCNLRSCTKQQNSINRSKSRQNSSGIIGVGWDKTFKRWIASWTENGKLKFRNFKSKTDAETFRQQKAKEVYGQFAP